MRISATLAIAAAAVCVAEMAYSQDLTPHYTPHGQSASERLQNFQPPPPPPQPRVEVRPMQTCLHGGSCTYTPNWTQYNRS